VINILENTASILPEILFIQHSTILDLMTSSLSQPAQQKNVNISKIKKKDIPKRKMSFSSFFKKAPQNGCNYFSFHRHLKGC